ncbi:hypothetical protein [Nonomuraea recticatena]|uniref:Uncharacterized protein n=1 Tax=Nonomuraea recticatena TaxID=46178 RepID=A0ABN3T811_9ACTN
MSRWVIRVAKLVAVIAFALAPAPMIASTAHAHTGDCPIATPECTGNSHWA